MLSPGRCRDIGSRCRLTTSSHSTLSAAALCLGDGALLQSGCCTDCGCWTPNPVAESGCCTPNSVAEPNSRYRNESGRWTDSGPRSEADCRTESGPCNIWSAMTLRLAEFCRWIVAGCTTKSETATGLTPSEAPPRDCGDPSRGWARLHSVGMLPSPLRAWAGQAPGPSGSSRVGVRAHALFLNPVQLQRGGVDSLGAVLSPEGL
jgi:hypothetical protein